MIGNKGLIGILSTERNGLPVPFVNSLLMLTKQMKNEVDVTFAHSGHIPDGRNLILKIAKEKNYDYVVMIDSDMTFPPTGINQLKYTMERMGADIGCGLYFGTYPPYKSAPMAYDESCECGHSLGFHHMTGLCKGSLTEGCECESIKPTHVPLLDWSRAKKIHSCGMGFTLITKKLFDLEFRFEKGKGEDNLFCVDARRMGHKIILDPVVKCGHLRTIELNEDTVNKLGI